jgi:hypothetical protein
MMIWLLAHSHPSLLSVSSTGEVTHRKTKKEGQLADAREGEEVGEEPNQTTARKPCHL